MTPGALFLLFEGLDLPCTVPQLHVETVDQQSRLLFRCFLVLAILEIVTVNDVAVAAS